RRDALDDPEKGLGLGGEDQVGVLAGVEAVHGVDHRLAQGGQRAGGRRGDVGDGRDGGRRGDVGDRRDGGRLALGLPGGGGDVDGERDRWGGARRGGLEGQLVGAR